MSPAKRLQVAAVLTAGAAALAGCGDGSGGSSPLRGGLREAGGQLPSAPKTRCKDWKAGTVRERVATVEYLRELIGKRTPAGTGPALDDKRAYEIIENACSNEFADNLLLFKIYGRAAAFRSVDPAD